MHDRLFVGDTHNSRVLIYDLSGGITNGMNASYVLGESDFTSSVGTGPMQSSFGDPTFSYPVEALAYDTGRDQLMVGNSSNSRVLVFDLSSGITNGMDASYVIGQPDFTTAGNVASQSGMGWIYGLAVDQTTHRLFVTDNSHNRVLVYDLSSGITNGMDANYVIGQPDFTTIGTHLSQSGFNYPTGVDYDPVHSRLFVADGNSDTRVLVFDLSGGITNGMDASYVLGQPDFTTGGYGTTQSSFSYAIIGLVAVDNKLYVADEGNNRILGFDLSSGITNGMDAFTAIGQSSNGQPTFTTGRSDNVTNTTFKGYPASSYVDTVRHRLFVATCGDQIVGYNLDAQNNLLDHTPDFVLGQASFAGGDESLQQNRLSCAYGLAFDSAHNRLFVDDDNNSRVLVFDLSGGVTNGMDASYVLGQPDFTTNSNSFSASSLYYPAGGMAYDPGTGYLYVNDTNHYRVLVFDLSSGITNGMDASYVIGQPDFTTGNSGVSQAGFTRPFALQLDTVHHRLFVADATYSSGRIVVFDTSHLANGMNASYILGQPDFTSTNAGTDASTFVTYGMTYDSDDQRLFVADDNANRILVFDFSGGISNGMAAAGVIGQPDFTTGTNYRNAELPSALTINDPEGSDYYDTASHRLYFSDSNNNRILIYDFARITSSTLSGGTEDKPYSQHVATNGTQGTTSFAVTAGSLPSGLSLNTTSGAISGTPTKSGTYQFTVRLSDNNGNAGTYTDTKSLVVTIAAQGKLSGSDGGSSGDAAPSSDQGESSEAIVLNDFSDFTSDAGKSIEDLKIGDVVHFCLGGSAGAQCNAQNNPSHHHTITVKSINLAAGTVTLTFASTPTDYTLALNVPQKVDVDHDGNPDVEATLNTLTATSAGVTFKELGVVQSQPTTHTDTKSSSKPTGQQNIWMYALIGLVVLIGSLGALTVLRYKSSHKASF